MNSAGSYTLPIVLAVGLHALVVIAIAVRWNFQSEWDATRIESFYIDAALVTENPYKKKAQEAAEAAVEALERRKKLTEDRAAAAKQERAVKERADAAKQELLEKVRKEEAVRLAGVKTPAPVKEKEKPAETQRPELSADERDRMEQNLAKEVLVEQSYRQAVTDDEKAMAYVARIKREIVQNWSRPPSARNGMEAILKVHLVPTGEVVDVGLVKSSRNEAFDRSAILAVKKAGRFTVPTDPVQFERNFRTFEVLFRPEDLRL